MAFTRIPTPEELSEIVMSIAEATALLNVAPTTNPQARLSHHGLQIIRVAGKPMLYRHEVLARVKQLSEQQATLEHA